jgi:hypothetical protein
MKKSICFIIILSLLGMKTFAQGTADKESSMLDNYIKSKVSISKTRIVSDTLARVFAGSFYKVDAGFMFTDEMSYCSGSILDIKDGAIFALDSRSDSMFVFKSLVRKDFSLKTESDAKLFEGCLDRLFPMDEMKRKEKEHLKKDNKWYFIRDTFFDSKSGYIVSVDPNGKILNIAHELEAIKK